jgi:ornithine carbamoyltransferase
MPKSLLTLADLSVKDLKSILDSALTVKSQREHLGKPLEGKSIGLLFEKPSTRTRVSFEVGIAQLGGHIVSLDSNNMQASRGEERADTAAVLGRYLDGLVCRTFAQENLEILAKHSNISIINALSDQYHPCQVIADCLTMWELNENKKPNVTFMGDGSSNVVNSLILASSMLEFSLTIAAPPEFSPAPAILRKHGQSVTVKDDIDEAVKKADFIYTDVFTSMGFEDEIKKRHELLMPYQVNMKLIKNAPEHCRVLHCLPAHKGEEITEEIFDMHRESIFMQAENRLHAQKALMRYLFN